MKTVSIRVMPLPEIVKRVLAVMPEGSDLSETGDALHLYDGTAAYLICGCNSLDIAATLVPAAEHHNHDRVVLGYFIKAGIITIEEGGA